MAWDLSPSSFFNQQPHFYLIHSGICGLTILTIASRIAPCTENASLATADATTATMALIALTHRAQARIATTTTKSNPKCVSTAVFRAMITQQAMIPSLTTLRSSPAQRTIFTTQTAYAMVLARAYAARALLDPIARFGTVPTTAQAMATVLRSFQTRGVCATMAGSASTAMPVRGLVAA